MAKPTTGQPAEEQPGGVIDPGELAALMGGDGAAEEREPETGGAPPAESPTPDLVTVRMQNGRVVTVSPEVADALEAERQHYATERGRLSQQLDTLRKPAEPERDADDRPEKPDWRLAHENFAEYDRRQTEYNNYRLLSTEDRVRKETLKEVEKRISAGDQQRAIDGFMERVGRAHTYLDGERDLLMQSMVRVAKAHPSDPLPYDEPRTMALVVEDANATLLRMSERARALTPAQKPPKVEGQGRTGGGTKTTITDTATKPSSIYELQRERRGKRRTAAAGA